MYSKTGLVVLFINTVTALCFSEACKQQGMHCSTTERSRRVHGTNVERDCFEYKYTLDCGETSKNDCASIPAERCFFVKESCAKTIKEGNLEFCPNNIRHFACEKQTTYTEKKEVLKKNGEAANNKDLLCNAMCLDGNCESVKKADLESNNELIKSVSMLNAVAGMKKGIDTENKTIINAFNGNKQECSYHPLEFMQCCKESPTGWGEAIGLGKCTPDELNLAKLRNQKQCVEVGAYCETDFIACVDKRRVFCCYDSVIARIINQEAKKQLGRGYGTPENPDCKGIDLVDLAKVDLSKADFSDFYNEIVVPNIKLPDDKANSDQIKGQIANIEKFSAKAPDERKGFNQEALGRLD